MTEKHQHSQQIVGSVDRELARRLAEEGCIICGQKGKAGGATVRLVPSPIVESPVMIMVAPTCAECAELTAAVGNHQGGAWIRRLFAIAEGALVMYSPLMNLVHLVTLRELFANPPEELGDEEREELETARGNLDEALERNLRLIEFLQREHPTNAVREVLGEAIAYVRRLTFEIVDDDAEDNEQEVC